MFGDAMIDGEEVPHVEGVIRVGKICIKVAWKERMPGIIPQVNQISSSIPQLCDKIVFFNGCASKVGAGIDEGG